MFLSLVLTVPDEGDEHEYKKDPSRELQVLFGLVLTQGWDSSEKCLALGTGLGQNQKEGSDKGKVPEQELHVPKDTVGYRLKNCKKRDCLILTNLLSSELRVACGGISLGIGKYSSIQLNNIIREKLVQ